MTLLYITPPTSLFFLLKVSQVSYSVMKQYIVLVSLCSHRGFSLIYWVERVWIAAVIVIEKHSKCVYGILHVHFHSCVIDIVQYLLVVGGVFYVTEIVFLRFLLQYFSYCNK